VRTIDARERTTASPDAVWALLADPAEWTRWGAWSRVEIEDGAEHGPGAVRVVVRRPFHIRERVTDWVPGERMGYEVLDGLNVRGYRAEVTLTPDGDGTVVRWHATYDRADPLTGLILRGAIRDACRRVAAPPRGR